MIEVYSALSRGVRADDSLDAFDHVALLNRDTDEHEDDADDIDC
jgi:hypothetical protein